MADVFISYSRKDKAFVRRLFTALASSGRDAWVDWESIPYSVQWWAEICDGIEKSDNFIFIVTLQSLSSKICNDELAYARQNKKRIIPVIRRQIDVKKDLASVWFGVDWETQARENWTLLEQLNWLNFRRRVDSDCDCAFDDKGDPVDADCDGPQCDLDDFGKAFDSLITTVKRDDAYVRKHRELFTAARQWEANQRDDSYLLRGEELATAKTWLKQSKGKDPAPTTLHREYVEESGMYEARIRAEEDRRMRRLRNFGRAVVLLVIVALVAGVIAVLGTITAANATGQVAAAYATLTPVFGQIRAAQNLNYSLQMAADANQAVQNGVGDTRLPVLLALRALKSAYLPENEAALYTAMDAYDDSVVFRPDYSLLPNGDPIDSAAFSPDGQRVLGYSIPSDSIWIWNAKTGKTIDSIHGVKGSTVKATFSPDGKWALTASTDSPRYSGNRLQLWDLEARKIVKELAGHSAEITAVAVSADSHYALSASKDKSIRLWDIAEGKEIKRFTAPTDAVAAIAFSPDGKSYLTANGMTATLWDATSGSEIRRFAGHVDIVIAIAFSPDGKTMVTGSNDNTARVWDVASGNLVRVLNSTDRVKAVAFSPNGQYILTSFALWDANTGQQLRQIVGHLDFVNAVAFSPDSAYALTGSADATARSWRVDANHKFRRAGIGSGGAVLSPNNRYVLQRNLFHHALLWDFTSGQLIRDFYETEDPYHGDVTGLAFSPDGKWALVGNHDGIARLWDISSGKVIQRYKGHSGPVNGVSFSPDGKYVLTGSDDKTARLWDTISGQEIRQFINDTDPISGVVFSPDGKSILTSYSVGTPTLWDASTGKRIEMIGHVLTVAQSGVFSPNGMMIINLFTADGTFFIYDLQSHKDVRTFAGPKSKVRSAVFSPDGIYVLSAYEDNTVRLWTTADGKQVRQLSGRTAQGFTANTGVFDATFSPDGRLILITSAGGLSLWDTNYADTMAYACDELPQDFGYIVYNTMGGRLDARQQYGFSDDKSATCPQFTSDDHPFSTPMPPTSTPPAAATIAWTPIASPTASPMYTLSPTSTNVDH
ncbi:MAG: TIR domain-containing protein [Chloroflexota bacterium]